jgi:hypothetical protein
MIARIGALVGAVAMVVVAIVVRGRIDDRGVSARLTCSTELAEACAHLGNGIKVTVEPAGATFDRLAALGPDADPGLDGWLVAGPWPEMLNADRRSRAQLEPFDTSGTRLASSPLVTVVETQRAPVLQKKCNPATWACVGAVASSMWKDLGGSESFGPVKADIPDPAAEAEGLDALGAMSASLFGDRTFDVNDDGLHQLLRNLRAAQLKPGADAVTSLLVSNGSETDVVYTTEATALSVKSSAADKNAATVLYPAPVTTANVELGTIATADRERVAKLTRIVRGSAGTKALAGAGWKPPSESKGTTDPGILAGLRAAWNQQR